MNPLTKIKSPTRSKIGVFSSFRGVLKNGLQGGVPLPKKEGYYPSVIPDHLSALQDICRPLTHPSSLKYYVQRGYKSTVFPSYNLGPAHGESGKSTIVDF